jgi:uncharacterized repeat protein (TIGR03806 family)
MKNISTKTIRHLLSIFKLRLIKIKTLFIIFASVILFSAIPYFSGPGLTTPEPMGAFLNGNFPIESTATPEPYRVAYQNLSFFYPITFRDISSRNKIIVGQLNGEIYSFDNDENTATKDILLDLSNEVGMVSDGGFLGLTTHPDFDSPTDPKNYIYVYYATKNWNGEDLPGFGQYTIQNCTIDEYQGNFLILERFEVSPFDENNPNEMTFVPNSRTTVLKNRMYGTTHRGGGMDFGDDGFLYLTMGDQASWQNAQDYVTSLDGGVIRIDVDKNPTKSHPPIRKKPLNAGFFDEISGEEYWIPNDNHFLSQTGTNFEEYWSVGLRNPHRLTKDSQSGIFYIGEVGLNTHEEINILGKGKNYGWPLFEGNIAGPGCFPNLLNNMPHEAPLVSFTPQEANSIIGGYVYRGSNIPELYGKYICADFGVGDEMWSVDTTTGAYEEIGIFLPTDVISFGEDTDGELYILRGGFNTPLYKMKSTTNVSYELFPQLLSETGIFTDLNTLAVTDGIVPYDLVESFWSDGALKRRWIAIPNNGTHNTPEEQIDYSENGDWDFPVGSVLIKHFDLRVDDDNPSVTRKIETRLMIMGHDNKFYFLTYNWNQAQTDAVLQTVELDEPVDIAIAGGGTRTQTWHFPSNSECLACHNDANKGALGLRSRYLNKDYTYDETGITANQLVTLSHLGILDETITDSDTPAILTGTSIYDANATLDEKARSYLDLNCAYCHRTETGNRAAFDLRLINSLESTNLLNAGILSPLGIPDEEIVFPGDASKSILYHKMNSVDPAIMMPPLSKGIIDQDAVDLIEEWINQLEAPIDDMNSPDSSINLALLSSARVEGSVTEGRGKPKDILYDPRIDDYYQTTTHNEYGVSYQQNLGPVDLGNAFEWKVSWPLAKNINYITFGGVFSNQPQANTNWRISYRYNNVWTTLEEGQGGWLNAGIFEWGNSLQTPILADAVKVQAYSDGVNDLVSIHFRGRGGISSVAADDSATTPKAALFQYLPPPTNCSIGSISAGDQTDCNEANSTYTQDITVTYVNEPSSGNLIVNNQIFPIGTSPQTVTLTGIISNGLSSDVEAYFSTEQTCALIVENLFTAPANCNIGNPDNSPNESINLGLVSDATLSGSESNGRGNPIDILYDPVLGNYRSVTSYNEYGVGYQVNLGTPDADNGIKWQVDWLNTKYINYVTFGGAYPNQPQPNTMWRISYHSNGVWTMLEEGLGGWINSGIYEWGGASQQPFIADALRIQLFSDNVNDLESIHLRGRGGNSNNEPDDSATTPKATLIQYIPLDNTCGLSLPADAFLYCNNTWKDGNLPSQTSATKDVYIGNGTYIANEDENIEVNNLEVSVDATLILKEGSSIKVHGNLVNNGSIQLESTSTKYSSLILEGSSTGTIKYKRHVNAYNGVTGNDLISAPLINQNFGEFSSNNPNIFENPNNEDQKLFGHFNELSGEYQIYSAINNEFTPLISGMGYRAARDASEDGISGTTLSFEGALETNTVNMDITETTSTPFEGWNLIGNPYASYIDFDAFFLLNKEQLDVGDYKAIYGYDGNASDGWKILNSATTNLLITPGQGFFVKTKSGGGTITFTPEMRVSGTSDDFIEGRTSSAHYGYLKLNLNSEELNYKTEFYFNSNSSLGLDPGYDAALFGGNPPSFSIYSNLVENNTGAALAIQCLNNLDINNVTIPLGINANAGQEVTFSIAQSDILQTINVYLEDNSNNTFTLLNTDNYSFTADADLAGAGRFYLRFEGGVLSALEQSLDGLKIYSNTIQKTIVIEGQLHSDTEFTLYDIHGRIVRDRSLNVTSTKQSIDTYNLNTGMYIIELVNKENQKRTHKLIIY